MNYTKKSGIIIIALFFITISAAAQPEKIGVGLTFATKKLFNRGFTGNPGLNVKTWISLDRQKVFQIVPSVSAFMPLEVNHTSYHTTTYLIHGDVDFQVRLLKQRSLKFAAIAGFNYQYFISKNRIITPPPVEVVDSTLAVFGPTIGLALDMRMSASWDFVVSARYSFAGLRPGDRSEGERFLVAPYASPVIQVQAVYYFYSRGRGYSYR